MTTFRKRISAAGAGLALLLAGGCEVIDPYAAVACPTIGVLDEAREITRFRHGSGRETSDIMWHAQINTVDFTCRQPEGKEVVLADAIIVATFTRGTAGAGDRQFFEMFSVLSEGQDRVVDKTKFAIDVKLAKGQQSVTRTRQVKGIKVPTNGKVAPELYNIYFGFQLTPAEVAYNRTRPSR